MSPRAAWRLERFGFGPVYDYAAGKLDWMAAGVPTVRADTTERRALDAIDPHPPTCGPDVAVAVAARLAADGGHASVIVLNDQGVVLGRLGPRGLTTQPDALAEDVMEAGPATVRAHEPLDALVERMRARRVSEILVTTPEGRLLGLIRSEST
jgi:CBS domain-containing protein